MLVNIYESLKENEYVYSMLFFYKRLIFFLVLNGITIDRRR
jgi:hypothetical protein